VVGEELLGGAELATGSGNNQRGYHRWGAHGARCWRGNSHCPTLLAGAAGMFSVQEGRGDGALLLVRLDNSKAAHRWLALVGEAAAGVEQSSEEPWSNGGRGK
jgi:hypothetical protein